jgi:hypothetical protein
MPNGNGNSTRLDSWKDIATYLRRDVRTAIRWEKEKGLPVRRVPGGQRKAVFAFTSELDAWLTHELEPQGLKPSSFYGLHGAAGSRALSKPEEESSAHTAPEGVSLSSPPFPSAPAGPDARSIFVDEATAPHSRRRKWRYYVALVAAAGIIASVGMAFWSRTHTSGQNFPVRVGFTLNSLQAFDADGQMLWSYALPGTVDPVETFDGRRLEDGIRIVDFRGDGEREVLAVLRMRVGPNATSINHSEVDMFSSRGKLLWSYVPRGRLRFATHDLKDGWNALDVFVSDHQGRKQIWVAVDHTVWGHSFIVNLDAETGKDTVRYVNSGTTVKLNELATPHGNFLLAGGFNNEYDSGTLAVIDESKAFAVSPQTEGTSHKCLNCPKGDPDYYFVFPRSEINELMQFYEDRIAVVRVWNDEIEVWKKETESNAGAQSQYLLKSDGMIRPVSVRFETVYDLLHNKLEREGKINHSLASCPERLHPRPVRMWTPVDGWMEIKLEGSQGSQ